MRLSIVLLFLSFGLIYANETYAQNTMISLNMADGRISDILENIENQTDYSFIYDSKVVDVNTKMSVDFQQENLFDLLNQLFAKTDVAYTVINDKIILNREQELEALKTQQEQRTVTGTVVDENGEPLPGVNVTLMGTTTGVITDMDGNYSINVPGNNSILQFSFIGYLSHEIVVGNQNSISVTLIEDTQLLDEVVVVGYGVQRKSNITGSISSIKSDEMVNRATETIGHAIQGKTAGVQIVYSSGAPGSGSAIRVRGYSSNSSSDPLYIVDGLKVTSIDYLDSESIESIEILKDAASAAIYGAEAGNGVVLITTKTGSNSANGRLFYNMQYSFQKISNIPSVLSSEDYISFHTWAGTFSEDLFNTYWDGATNTNWIDHAFETGYVKRHTAGFQGGNDKGNLFVSLSYYDNDGIVTGSKDSYQRLTSQVNADFQIKSWLKIGTTNSIEISSTSTVPQNSETSSLITSALLYDPLTPVVYDNNNLPSYVQTWVDLGYPLVANEDDLYYGSSYWVQSEMYHPLVQRDYQDITADDMGINGTLFADFTPLKNFTFTSKLGYRISTSDDQTYRNPYFITDLRNSLAPYLSYTESNTLYYQWENYANYILTSGKSTYTAMAGMSFQSSKRHRISANTNALSSIEENFRYLDYSTSDATDNISGNTSKSANMSYFGRFGWSYDSRYNLQASFRADAFDTSKLSKKSRWGYFPSISAGWTISNEEFMSNISKNILSSLKLRSSWGINGNVNVLSGYAYATSMASGDRLYWFNDGSGAVIGVNPSTMLANEDLKWETSKQIDVGLEASFLKDRLSFMADFYSKNTHDLLASTTPTLATGASSAYINAGLVHNHGFEFELGWKDQIGDFGYSISSNLSTLENKVVEDTGTPIEGNYVHTTGYLTYFEEGYPIWYMKAYTLESINDDGSPNYIDYNNDGNITDDDRVYSGSGIPDYTYGITLNANYKGVDLTVFGAGSQGSEIYCAMIRGDYTTVNRLSYFYEEAGKSLPAPAYQMNARFLMSNGVIFDGSYFKIKQIQVGYTVPQKVLSKISISSLRAYVSLDDFFTFTDYIGMDPETQVGTTSGLGVDKGSYPISKKVTLGLNVTF